MVSAETDRLGAGEDVLPETGASVAGAAFVTTLTAGLGFGADATCVKLSDGETGAPIECIVAKVAISHVEVRSPAPTTP